MSLRDRWSELSVYYCVTDWERRGDLQVCYTDWTDQKNYRWVRSVMGQTGINYSCARSYDSDRRSEINYRLFTTMNEQTRFNYRCVMSMMGEKVNYRCAICRWWATWALVTNIVCNWLDLRVEIPVFRAADWTDEWNHWYLMIFPQHLISWVYVVLAPLAACVACSAVLAFCCVRWATAELDQWISCSGIARFDVRGISLWNSIHHDIEL